MGRFSECSCYGTFQRVLKELVTEKLPRLQNHFEQHDVDLSLYTFNWFLTIFVDNVRPETFLRCWDALLYEGSKVSPLFDTHDCSM